MAFSDWSLRATFQSLARRPVKDSRSELAQSLTGRARGYTATTVASKCIDLDAASFDAAAVAPDTSRRADHAKVKATGPQGASMKIRIFFAMAALLTFDANACDCSVGPVEAGMNSADLVFGANVVSATVRGSVVEIEVDGVAVLKGDAKGVKILTTPVGRSACGFLISVPERYVFFTNSRGELNSCGSTRLLGDPELGVLTSKVIRMWRSGSSQ